MLTQQEGPIGIDLGLVEPDDMHATGLIALTPDSPIRVRPRTARLELVEATLARAWLQFEMPSGGAQDPGEIVIGEDESMTGSIQACSLDDQARGALLLAVADLALGHSEPLPQVIVQPVEGQETGVSYGIMGEIEPSVELPGGSAILSWPQVQVAHHLVNQEPAAIAALHDDMDRWMEPTTGLDELVAATGAPCR